MPLPGRPEVRGNFPWPGAIHEGKGEAAVVIDDGRPNLSAGALLRIPTGQDTEPWATVCCVQIATAPICSYHAVTQLSVANGTNRRLSVTPTTAQAAHPRCGASLPLDGSGPKGYRRPRPRRLHLALA